MDKENKIREKRLALGWSQQKLADDLGCSVGIIHSWERLSDSRYPNEWTENLILEHLEKVNSEQFKDNDVFYIKGRYFEIFRNDSDHWCCMISLNGETQTTQFESYQELLESIMIYCKVERR